MADMSERPTFGNRWWDLIEPSLNVEDRRGDGRLAYARHALFDRRPPPGYPPPVGDGKALGADDIGRKPDPSDVLANRTMEPQNMLGPLLSMWGFVPRDDAASLASRKERANKMRGAYNDFFNTPGQKAAMEDKNVTPLTPGDSYYNNTLNFTDANKPFMSPAVKSGNPWWLDLAKQLGGVPETPTAPTTPVAPPGPPMSLAPPGAAPPGPPMSLAPPNPGPSSGPGVVPPQRMASAVTGDPNLPNMVDPTQLPQQGLFARTVMDPNTGGMMNDFATKRPGDDLAGLFRSLIGK